MARLDDLPPEIIIQILIEVQLDDMMEPAEGTWNYFYRPDVTQLMNRFADKQTDNLSSLIAASERVHQIFHQNRYAIFQQLVKRLIELLEPGSTDGMPANMVVYQQLLRLDAQVESELAAALPALVSGIPDEEKATLLQTLRHTPISKFLNPTLFADILKAIRDRYDWDSDAMWYSVTPTSKTSW
jgi:hypothetical protein